MAQSRLFALAAFSALVVAGSQLAMELRLGAQQLPAVLTAEQRKVEDDYLARLKNSQQPAACPMPNVTAEIRLDAYGRPRDPFGSATRPFYLSWSELKIVAPALNGSPGVLRARIAAAPPNPNEYKPFTTVAHIDKMTGTSFEREVLMRNGSPGLVRIDVEYLPHGAAAGLPVTTLHVIPATPFTVVLNESGPVDPRFANSFSSQHLPCQDGVSFRYAPTKPEFAVVPLTITHALPFATNGTLTKESLRRSINASVGLATRDEKIAWSEMETDADNKVADLVVERHGTAVALLSLTQNSFGGFQPPARLENGTTIFPVTLDRTGVASGRYLNRRRPPLLSFVQEAFIRFDNTLSDRQFIVTFSGIPEASRAELVASGLKVTDCRDAKCKASAAVMANSPALVPLSGLREALAKGDVGGVVTFQVSFFDDEITPSNSAGYFTFVDEQNFREAGSSTAWTSAISVTAQRDPDLTPFVRDPVKVPVIDFAHPARTEQRNRFHFVGGATIGIKQQLGARADGEVEFVAKKGDFGFDTGAVTASKYLATVYALKTVTLTAGRFDLAAPTNSISLSEAGEAINAGVRFGNAQAYLGRITRKEIPDGSFTVAESIKARAGLGVLDKNHGAWLLQFRDATFGTDRLRTSVYALRGDAKRGYTPAGTLATDTTVTLTPYYLEYWTTGADVFLTGRASHVTGGLYYNTRSSDDAPAPEQVGLDKNGVAGLVTANYSKIDEKLWQGKKRVSWTVSGTVAGGGDYVGETQAFAPDVLFLSMFAPALREPSYPVGTGLTNKWYFGGVLTVPQWNLLGRLNPTRPSARDINGASMSFKLHHYRQRAADAADRTLATEADVEFRVESPKGVRFQLVLAGMWPGEALRAPMPGVTLVEKFQYAVKFGMTVRLE